MERKGSTSGQSSVNSQKGPGLGGQRLHPQNLWVFIWPSPILVPLRSQPSGCQDKDRQESVPRRTARIHKHPLRKKALGAGSYSLREGAWGGADNDCLYVPSGPSWGRTGPWLGTRERLHNESSVDMVGLPQGGVQHQGVHLVV